MKVSWEECQCFCQVYLFPSLHPSYNYGVQQEPEGYMHCVFKRKRQAIKLKKNMAVK